MITEVISYEESGKQFDGVAWFPDREKRPCVILCHAWRGRDEFICKKAKEMALLGYIGFALDMYGGGVVGESREECTALKKPFTNDRGLLQRRVVQAYKTVSQIPHVDENRIVVMGYGFGGMCALDLARSGVPIKGAVSIYGHLDSPDPALVKKIQAKILVLHGYNDPIVSMEEFGRFEREMAKQRVDWQAHLYGNAMHAFATPGANDAGSGLMYDPLSAQRAECAFKSFCSEMFEGIGGRECP